MKRFLAILFVLMFISGMAGIAHAITFTPNIIEDVSLRSAWDPDFGTWSYDSYNNQSLRTRAYKPPYEVHEKSYLKIDLSGISPGDTISSAVLKMYAYDNKEGSGTYISRFDNDAWDDGPVGTSHWQVDLWNIDAGAEYIATGDPGAAEGVWVTFDLTLGITEQDLIDGYLSIGVYGPSAHSPWSGFQYATYFRSMDFSEAEYRPSITIEANAVIPEPATMILLGSGLIGLAGFRRKWATRGRSS